MNRIKFTMNVYQNSGLVNIYMCKDSLDIFQKTGTF